MSGQGNLLPAPERQLVWKICDTGHWPTDVLPPAERRTPENCRHCQKPMSVQHWINWIVGECSKRGYRYWFCSKLCRNEYQRCRYMLNTGVYR